MPDVPSAPVERATADAAARPSLPVGAAPAASGLEGGDARHPFAYALLRVVPRIDRGECVNVGVVLFCRPRRFLGVRLGLDPVRLAALAPDLDLEEVARHLEMIERVASGDPAGGAIARLPAAERFGWLVAPASTVVQPGPVHAGLGSDPEATLGRLFAALVAVAPLG